MASTAGGTVAPGRSGTPDRPGVLLTEISLVIMALIWGVNFISVKYGTEVMAPLAFNGVRVALAAVTLVAVVAVMRVGWPSRGDALRLLGLGVLGNGVYQIFFVEGLARTRAGDAALVLAASPVFIAIIGGLRGVERVRLRAVVGIVLSIAGIGLVMLNSSHGEGADAAGATRLLGDTLVLLASLVWSVYTVLLTPLSHRVNGITLSAVTMVGGAIPLALFAGADIVHTDWAHVDPRGWAALGYSGLFALVIAYLIWYRGVRAIGPTRTAMFANLQPLFTVLIAWPVFGEVITAWTVLGGACIMLGLLLTRSGS